MPRRVNTGAWIALACVLVALGWLLRLRASPAARVREPESSADAPVEPPPDAGRGSRQPRAPAAAVDAAVPALPWLTPSCQPRASKGCHEGDVFWFDSCGHATELIEGCDGRTCFDIACAPAERVEDRCGSISSYGRCEGELAQACVAGEVVTVDCAREGKRCTTGREGVRCEKPGPGFCSGREPARCEGRRLLQCNDGRWQVTDCARRGGECNLTGGSGHCAGARAVLPVAPVEVCNQRDDDGDGQVDEGGVCDVVSLAPLVAPDASLPDLDAQMQRDLEILRRVYAPRDFRWEHVIQAPEGLARFPAHELERVAISIGTQVAAVLGAAKFFVPVLYVDSLDMEPPKGGISTLPNNRCGGVRMGDAPTSPYGLIVLPKERMPETLAHEMGHFLGLCHTHEQVERYALPDPDAAPCELTGDGICDTAFDPGPESCKADPTCVVLCQEARAQPLGVDIMSYYLGCRRGLSADQLRETERNLSLRRGWARCLDPAGCPCTPGEVGACPVEMSCRPFGNDAFGCRLDGPGFPGTGCRDATDCGTGALCLKTGEGRGRCARACLQSAPDCACTDVGLSFKACREDLGG